VRQELYVGGYILAQAKRELAEVTLYSVEVTDNVATVTIRRPAQRNAMSAELVRDLIDTLVSLEGDRNNRVIILTGSESGFCAGSDLGGLARMDEPTREMFEAQSGKLGRLLGELPIPTIAAVHGYAIGGGMTLATSCDLIVAQRSARWSLPEVPIGLFPAWGIESVVDRVGRTAAKRLAWGIDTLSGDEALRLGLVDVVVEDDPVRTARDIAVKLAALPQPQAGYVKEYFLKTGALCREESDAVANALFARSLLTDIAKRHLERFIAK
jgi:enoyl-CoA hydratase/carnithine racemase